MAATALITGASGFIGRNISKLYAGAGWTVIGIGHGAWAEEDSRVWGITRWHAADVTLDSLMRHAGKPDAVIHCAGGGSVGFSIDHPQQDFERTVATASAVLEFCRLHAPEARIVYPSSAAVYGSVDHSPIAECDARSPVSPYGVHKEIVEGICRASAEDFGLKIAIVRLFSVYGTGLRKQLLWDACIKIRRGENSFFGTGEETRDLLHIDDAARLLMAAARQASRDCPVANGGSGEGVTVRNVLTELFRAFDRRDAPVFSGSTRAGDPLSYVADVNRAHSWKWSPMIQWRAGVRDYAEWFRAATK
jgi:UDP-glucose 4-epimerase